MRNRCRISTILPCVWQFSAGRLPGSLGGPPAGLSLAHLEPSLRPDSLAVIGLGAIGGSLAWQAARAGVPRVVGYSPIRGEGVAALRAGAITELADSPLGAAREAELVVLATPPAAALELLPRLADALGAGAVLTDVASVKAPVVAGAVAAGLGARFAGAHPLAGTHGSGFEHAAPDRLRGCIAYVCAAPEGEAAARTVMSFWERTLEASPVRIDALAHDRQLAWTSHLPQGVASALAHALAGRGLGGVSFGTGARDTTRLAASSAELWVDIFLQNGEPVSDALAAVEVEVGRLRALIAAADRAGLRRWLEEAVAFRRAIDR